jgi:hypothetical protein
MTFRKWQYGIFVSPFGHTEKQNLKTKSNTNMTPKLASLITLGLLIIAPAFSFTGCSMPDSPAANYPDDSNVGNQMFTGFQGFYNIFDGIGHKPSDTASQHGLPVNTSKPVSEKQEAVR